jgi:hypothetical protein
LPGELGAAFAAEAECRFDLKTTWPVVMSETRWEAVKPDAEPTCLSRVARHHSQFLDGGQQSADQILKVGERGKFVSSDIELASN